jgi:hypothetical protein
MSKPLDKPIYYKAFEMLPRPSQLATQLQGKMISNPLPFRLYYQEAHQNLSSCRELNIK